MEGLNKLENGLDEVFVKKSPVQLPENFKKAIVDLLPWIVLVFSGLMLLSAWRLWDWANTVNQLADLANNFSRALGGEDVVSKTRLTAGVWVALAALVAEALLYLAAFFGGLRERKKSGWNYLFYAALVNIIYGITLLFTDYNNAGGFVGSLIGSVIGLYFLFQIRSYYAGGRSTAKATKVASDTSAKSN